MSMQNPKFSLNTYYNKAVGTKYFHHKHPFRLENGAELPELQIAYHTYGTLNENASNVVWVCHAFSANADVADWWSGMVGQEHFLNPDKYFIVCANIIGSCYGSSGPVSLNPKTNEPYFIDFPLVTVRDMVNAHELLRQHLGLEKIYVGIGGSLGGHQLMEWAILQPDLFESIVLISTSAKHSAWGIAYNEAQRMAIYADPTWQERRFEAGQNGLKAARAVALLSYRNYDTYVKAQTEPTDDKIDNFKASSYQQYQGVKLIKRFNVLAYIALSKAMDSHNVSRGRGSLTEVLGSIKARTLVIGVSSDYLFPVVEQKLLAELIPNAIYTEIDSGYGHDGFLVEIEKVGKLLSNFFVPMK